MIRVTICVLFAAMLLLRPDPGAAAESSVRTMGATLRLVAEPPDAAGRFRGALLIDLEPGWKTYWIDPGESGLAPVLDFGASAGVEAPSVRYPAPERFREGDFVSNGYSASPAFAFESRAGAGARLDLSLTLGLCRDICVPVAARLAIAPGEAFGLEEAITVDRAFLALPRNEGERWGGHLDGRMLTVEAGDVPGADDLFVAGPEGWRFGPARRATEGGRVRYVLPVLESRAEAPRELVAVVTGARPRLLRIDIR